jgi:hypothetical protein
MLDPVARTLTTCGGSAQNSFSFQDSDPFLGRTEFPLMSHAYTLALHNGQPASTSIYASTDAHTGISARLEGQDGVRRAIGLRMAKKQGRERPEGSPAAPLISPGLLLRV